MKKQSQKREIKGEETEMRYKQQKNYLVHEAAQKSSENEFTHTSHIK